MRADARAEMPNTASNTPAIRTDDWQNVYTALGTLKDKRLGTEVIQARRFQRRELSEMYRGSDVVATIVDVPADEMTREWLEFIADDDADNEVNAKVMDFLDGADEGPEEDQGIQAREAMHEALKWARLYGGSGIVMGVNDGRPSDQPINFAGIKSVDFLNVLDRHSLRAATYYKDPMAKKFGRVELYQILNTTGAEVAGGAARYVHESRVIRFDGVKLPLRDIVNRDNDGWGDSVLTRVWEVVRDYASVWMGFSYLLSDYAQTTIKIKGLANALGRPEGATFVARRMEAIEMSRSIARAVMLDEGEEFKRETVSLAGIPESMQKFVERLAQAARMPIELLMGQPPGGINGNGETGMRYWYAQVNAMQERMLRPALMKLLRVVLAAKNGPTKGQVPERWSLNFKPLDIPTESERADIYSKVAAASVALVGQGILDPEEAANSHFGSGKMQIDVKLDDEIRAQLAPKNEQARAPGPSQEEQMLAEVEKAKALASVTTGQEPDAV